ncbi:MAG: SDR family oxidoreductase [Acidimicrobiia bacterium]|nr:SDR family oxidoreductase [Acidimicrobiia bacterium]
MRLEGKVAIITGAGSGIGRACAQRFAREGAAIVGVDRDGEGLAQTVGEIVEAGGRARSLAADVTDTRAAARAVDHARELGGVDVLVTAAGRSLGKKVQYTSEDEWDDIFAVNVKGTFLYIQAVLPAMLEAGRGSIVTVASQLAFAGARGNTAYAASKGAVVSMTRTVAVDYASRGVRVNTLAPGAIDTPLLRNGFGRLRDPDTARAASLARHPMGRFGEADEIASAALYLASDESSFTTGTVLVVDGGWLAG